MGLHLGTLDAAHALTESEDSHQVAFRSPQQLRGFNAPFQLGRAHDSPDGEADNRFETPHDAALVRVPIKAGDLVVLATDGLFDNMPESAEIPPREITRFHGGPRRGLTDDGGHFLRGAPPS